MVGVGRMCLGPSGPPQLRRTSPPPGLLPRVCSHCMLGESATSASGSSVVSILVSGALNINYRVFEKY